MLELKNNKTTYLGGSRFALDAFIGAVQMREPDGQWADIKPRLVRKPTDDGYYVDRVPYYAEFNDDGSRLFCPDKYQRSEFFGLSAIPLLTELPKNLVSSPAKLDGEILPNKVVMPASWGEIRIHFTNTAMQFEVLFNEAPPSAIFGKDSPRLTFNTDLAGLDILKLLSEKQGLGIPRPRLIDADEIERWLNWSFKDGQLELGFDLTGLKFPVLLKNTTLDLQVGASADDAQQIYSTMSITIEYPYTLQNRWLGHRYLNVTAPQGATIDVAYETIYSAGTSDDDPDLNLFFEDIDNAPAFTTDANNISGRTRTTATDVWTATGIGTGWKNTPSRVGEVKEVVDRAGWVSGNAMASIGQGRSSATLQILHWDYSDHSYAPKFHVEYTAGAPPPGISRGWWSK